MLSNFAKSSDEFCDSEIEILIKDDLISKKNEDYKETDKMGN